MRAAVATATARCISKERERECERRGQDGVATAAAAGAVARQLFDIPLRIPRARCQPRVVVAVAALLPVSLPYLVVYIVAVAALVIVAVLPCEGCQAGEI